MKGISRSEINRLMAIPEAQQIIDAKFVELRLIFKHKLREKMEQQMQEWEDIHNNIIPFPFPLKKSAGNLPLPSNHNDNHGDGNMPTIIKIVDASAYRYEPEKEQVRIFMDYFQNHSSLRKAVLDEFFLRILPYSNLKVE